MNDKKVISEGMIVKIDNALEALRAGVKRVVICSAEDLLDVIAHKEGVGTVITLE
jgi:acetylglutamate kinase